MERRKLKMKKYRQRIYYTEAVLRMGSFRLDHKGHFLVLPRFGGHL